MLQYGYIVLFLGMLIDASGLPFPGDLLLIASGYLSYRGDLSLGYAIPIAALAALLGDSMTFSLGRLYCLKGGAKIHSYICKWSKCTLASKTCFERSCNSLKKLGTKSVLLGKFMWGSREFIPILSGMSGMTYKTFFRWDVLGVLVWVCIYTLGGFFFGSNLEGLLAMFEDVTTGLGIGALILAVGLPLLKFSQKLFHGKVPLEQTNLSILGKELSEKR